MSIHVYTPLDHEEVAQAIQQNSPDHRENMWGDGCMSGRIYLVRAVVRYTVDTLMQIDADFRTGARSKVNFWGLYPVLEAQKPLQETLAGDPEVDAMLKKIIDSLSPIDVLEA